MSGTDKFKIKCSSFLTANGFNNDDLHYTLFVVNSAVVTYNAALNRPAYQSSVHHVYHAHYANDGSRHTGHTTGTHCAVTNGQRNPWWAVDLEHPAAIYKVDLTSSVSSGRKTNIRWLRRA